MENFDKCFKTPDLRTHCGFQYVPIPYSPNMRRHPLFNLVILRKELNHDVNKAPVRHTWNQKLRVTDLMYYVNNSLHPFNTDISLYTLHIYYHEAPLARQRLLFYAAIKKKKTLPLYSGLYVRYRSGMELLHSDSRCAAKQSSYN